MNLDEPTEREIDAMKIVVDYLDDMMVKKPSRELTNASNLLQKILDNFYDE